MTVEAGAAENRWALPSSERHLPVCPARQGHRRAALPERRGGHPVAGRLAKGARRPTGPGAVGVGGRRAVRGPGAQDRLGRIWRTVPVIAAKNTTVPQAVGPMLDRVHALLKSIRRSGYRTCSTRPSRPSTERRTTSARCRVGVAVVRRFRGCGRPVPHADRGQPPLLDGRASVHRRHPDLGLQPRRDHRPTERRRSAVAGDRRTGPAPPTRPPPTIRVKPTLPVLLANPDHGAAGWR